MKFAIENFKIFNQKAEFDIRPITLFVGPNGSGKSTVIEFMELLSRFNIRKARSDDMFTNEILFENNALMEAIEKFPLLGNINRESMAFEFTHNSYTIKLRYSNRGIIAFVILNENHNIITEFKYDTITLKTSFFKKLSKVSTSVEYLDFHLGEPTFSNFGYYNFVYTDHFSLHAMKDDINDAKLELYKLLDEADFKVAWYEISSIVLNALDQYYYFNKLSTSRYTTKKVFEAVDNYSLSDNCLEMLLGNAGESLKNAELANKVSGIFNRLTNRNIQFEFAVMPNNEAVVAYFIENRSKHFIKELSYGMINIFSISLALALLHTDIYRLKLGEADEVKTKGFSLINKMFSRKKNNIQFIVIQEPEMNLHPNAQSKFADEFADLIKDGRTSFLLETHSEYLVRRLQYLVAKGVLSKDMVQIYYFNDPNIINEGDERVYPININDDGSLTRPFGPGFFDEAAKLNLLLYNRTSESNN